MAQTSLENSQHSLSLGFKSMGSKEYESDGETTASRPPIEFVFANTSNNHGQTLETNTKSFSNEEEYDHESGDDLQKTNSKASALIMMNRTSRSPSVASNPGGEQDVRPIGLTMSSSGTSNTYRTRRRGSSSRVERDAYLEVVKNKSWANLSGYDTDRPKSRDNNIFLNILKQSIENDSRDNIARHVAERRKLSSGSDFESKKPDDPRNRYAHYKEVLKRRSLSESDSHPSSLNHPGSDRKTPVEKGTIIIENNLFDTNIEATSEPSLNHHYLVESGSTSLHTTSTRHSPHGTIIVENDDFSELRDTQSHFFSRNSTSMFSPKSNRTRKIDFSTVEVRQYERILGDNPSCSSGAPVSIGWKFFQERTLCLSVDEYEYYHGHFRDECDMVLDRQERETLLYELGYSEKDLAKVVRENVKMKRNRRQTVNNLPIMKIEVAVESMTKKLTGAFRSKDKSVNKYGDSFQASATSSLSGSELKSCLKIDKRNVNQSDL